MLVDEHQIRRLRAYPVPLDVGLEGPNDSRVERPCPRIVGLVFVEAYGAADEVEGRNRERPRLAVASPLAVEETEQEPVMDGDAGRHQGGVFGRVQV
ncbi:MAG TPA: hypothetical protein VH062_13575 [Polyangiaceae bacterium]|nr:hypothetical protein [Polyangiaceae bacterium]